MRADRAALAALASPRARLTGLRLLAVGFFFVDLRGLDPGFRLLADRRPECRRRVIRRLPATGTTAVRTQSTHATHRVAILEPKLGKKMPSYLHFIPLGPYSDAREPPPLPRNHARDASRNLARPTTDQPAFGSLPCRPVHSSFDGLFTAFVRPSIFLNDFRIQHPMTTIQSIAGENEQHPDVALVEKVRAGDVSAYDTLVRKYERQIFRIAQHITQNREDAEDVMQDAFSRPMKSSISFRGIRNSTHGWFESRSTRA